jgi:2-polyprenyl-3-methyl-5-hydroxy-6-metoxy-1,4-benzoquinol methylase
MNISSALFDKDRARNKKMKDSAHPSMCSLCTCDQFRTLFIIPQLARQILTCAHCGLVFVYPQNNSFLTFDFEDKQEREEKYLGMRIMSESEGTHDEKIVLEEQNIKANHFNHRKKEIEHYAQRGNLLDLGCGRGCFLLNFVNSGFDYLGIEPRKRIASIAKERVGADNIFCGTLKEANLPDSKYDVVTMINLIEHLPSPFDTLREVNRVLKEQGILFIETPNVDSIMCKILRQRWHAFLEREHHYFFSKHTLRKMLAVTGFDVIKTKMSTRLLTIKYLLFRLQWYNSKLPHYVGTLLSESKLLGQAIRIPQFDEFFTVAKKCTSSNNTR